MPVGFSASCTFDPAAGFRSAVSIFRWLQAVLIALLMAACGGGSDPILPPSITSQPTSQSVSAGSEVTYSVAATGTAPLSYQWQSSTDGSTFTPIPGATGANYSTTAVGLDRSGTQFRVVVSNGAGTVTSIAVAILVTPSTAGLVCTGANGSGWCTISSLPQTNSLNAVAKATTSTLVAVGDARTIVRSSDGGLTWTTLPSGTTQALLAVAFARPELGLAVGAGGTILRSTNAGQTWAPISTPLGTSATFNAVAFPSPTVAVVTNGDQRSTSSGVILRSQDGGQTWTGATVPAIDSQCAVSPCPSYQLSSVSFANSDVGIATNNGDLTATALRTSDGGRTWSASSADYLGFSRSVALITPETGVSVGNSGCDFGLFRTNDSGQKWENIFRNGIVFLCPNVALRAVSFANRDLGITVGGGGGILRTIDGGMNWTPSSSRTGQYLNGVVFVNPSTAVVVGANGTILITTTAGACRGPVGNSSCIVRPPQQASNLNAVAKADASTLVAVGDDGRILRSSDAGLNWTDIASGTTEALHAVAFSGAELGLAAGAKGTILRSTDAGKTWTPVTTPLGTGAAFSAVAFASPSIAIVTNGNQKTSSSGVILRSEDGGQTWNDAAVPSIDSSCTASPCPAYRMSSVSFASAGIGIATNNESTVRTVLRTTDGGRTWTSVSNDNIGVSFGVALLSSDAGIVVGAFGSRSGILSTIDGARTWNVVQGGWFVNDRPVFQLRAVSFANPEVGVAVGDGGAIASTTNTGTSWITGAVWVPGFVGGGESLNGVVMLDQRTAIAVGDRGIIAVTSFGSP